MRLDAELKVVGPTQKLASMLLLTTNTLDSIDATISILNTYMYIYIYIYIYTYIHTERERERINNGSYINIINKTYNQTKQ